MVTESKLAVGIKININHCEKAPSDLPNFKPITSTAAFPFVRSSRERGMYAISLVESKKEYFVDLLKIFYMAHITTAKYIGLKHPKTLCH
jgi:hypothetical protein